MATLDRTLRAWLDARAALYAYTSGPAWEAREALAFFRVERAAWRSYLDASACVLAGEGVTP